MVELQCHYLKQKLPWTLLLLFCTNYYQSDLLGLSVLVEYSTVRHRCDKFENKAIIDKLFVWPGKKVSTQLLFFFINKCIIFLDFSKIYSMYMYVTIYKVHCILLQILAIFKRTKISPPVQMHQPISNTCVPCSIFTI